MKAAQIPALYRKQPLLRRAGSLTTYFNPDIALTTPVCSFITSKHQLCCVILYEYILDGRSERQWGHIMTPWTHNNAALFFSERVYFPSSTGKCSKPDIMECNWSSKWSMSTTITVLQKITSTILLLPFSMTYGGEGAARMGSCNSEGGSKHSRVCLASANGPMWALSLTRLSSHKSSPKSISQENENSKRLYAVLATQENLAALML